MANALGQSKGSAMRACAAPRIFSTRIGRKPVDLQRHSAARLGDEIDRTELDGLQSRLGSLLCQRRDDHHRSRRFNHDLTEAFQTVHARHLDIERHDMWIKRLHKLKAPPLRCVLDRISKSPSSRKSAFEQLSHQRRIVGDEEFDHEAFDTCSGLARSNLASTSASI